MVSIAKCESGLKQFKADGSVVVSPTHDYGIMQVNRKVWHATAEKMGLDYQNNIHDNLKLARHIYQVQGVTAWVCYQKVIHYT